jgi:hypothetical protein
MINSRKVLVVILLLLFWIELYQVSEAISAQNRRMDGESFSSQLTTVFGLGNRISRSGSEMLLPFRRNGKLHLSLTDCIDIALERNLNIHLIEETLAQADADITRAWSAMLPFVGIETSYTRLDEDLVFGFGLCNVHGAGYLQRRSCSPATDLYGRETQCSTQGDQVFTGRPHSGQKKY